MLCNYRCEGKDSSTIIAVSNLLTVVMPAHNEGAVVAEAVERVIELFPANSDEIVVHIVLDGPDSAALQALNQLNRANVKVTELGENYGKGHCLRIGASESSSVYTAFLDSDLDIDPISILQGLEILENNKFENIGCVYGSKFHPNSVLSYPPLRTIASKVFKFIVKILFGLNIEDSQTGLKLFRSSDLQRVISSTKENRFMFDLEVMILLNRLGVKMVPVPVNLNYKFSSSIGIKSIVVLGAQTIGLFLRQVRKRK